MQQARVKACSHQHLKQHILPNPKFARTGEVNQRGIFVKSLTLEFVNLQTVLTVETFERVDTAVQTHFM